MPSDMEVKRVAEVVVNTLMRFKQENAGKKGKAVLTFECNYDGSQFRTVFFDKEKVGNKIEIA